jgi:hypothetical protein
MHERVYECVYMYVSLHCELTEWSVWTPCQVCARLCAMYADVCVQICEHVRVYTHCIHPYHPYVALYASTVACVLLLWRYCSYPSIPPLSCTVHLHSYVCCCGDVMPTFSACLEPLKLEQSACGMRRICSPRFGRPRRRTMCSVTTAVSEGPVGRGG